MPKKLNLSRGEKRKLTKEDLRQWQTRKALANTPGPKQPEHTPFKANPENDPGFLAAWNRYQGTL